MLLRPAARPSRRSTTDAAHHGRLTLTCQSKNLQTRSFQLALQNSEKNQGSRVTKNTSRRSSYFSSTSWNVRNVVTNKLNPIKLVSTNYFTVHQEDRLSVIRARNRIKKDLSLLIATLLETNNWTYDISQDGNGRNQRYCLWKLLKKHKARWSAITGLATQPCGLLQRT